MLGDYSSEIISQKISQLNRVKTPIRNKKRDRIEIALMNEVKVAPTLKAQKLSKSVLSTASLLAPVRSISKKFPSKQ